MEIEKRNSQETSIGVQFQMLWMIQDLTKKEVAEFLMLKEEELEEIRIKEDSEISREVLYACYFYADGISKNVWKLEDVCKIANSLKEKCEEELKKRREILD